MERMFLNLLRNSISLIIWVVFFASCASVSSPKGGDIDDIPPELNETSPKILTDIKPTQKITIEFNEYLDESSLKMLLQYSQAVNMILGMNIGEIRLIYGYHLI